MFYRSLIAASLLFVASPVFAASGGLPSPLGKFGNWSAFTVSENGQKACYMSLSMRPPATKKLKRGKVVLMITQRPSENSSDVVSLTAGTKMKTGVDLEVSLGPKKFDLFTQGDTGWARDSATDHALTTAIRTGSTLLTRGVASSGAVFEDALPLKGSAQAYAAMNKACGLPVPETPKEKAKPKKKPVPKASAHKSSKVKKHH